MYSLLTVANAIRQAHGDKPLSELRLEYLIFLADWHSSLSGTRLTDAQWEIAPIMIRPKIALHQRHTLKNISPVPVVLDEAKQKVIDHLVTLTRDMDFDDLVEVMLNSYPLTRPTLYAQIGLQKLASDYHSENANNSSRYDNIDSAAVDP